MWGSRTNEGFVLAGSVVRQDCSKTKERREKIQSPLLYSARLILPDRRQPAGMAVNLGLVGLPVLQLEREGAAMILSSKASLQGLDERLYLFLVTNPYFSVKRSIVFSAATWLARQGVPASLVLAQECFVCSAVCSILYSVSTNGLMLSTSLSFSSSGSVKIHVLYSSCVFSS